MPLPSEIDTDELRARLAFWRVRGVGPSILARALETFGSAQAMFAEKSLPDRLNSLAQQADWKGAELDLHWLSSSEHHLLMLESVSFPSPLAFIPMAPPWLFVKGNLELLSSLQLGFVGSRHPTYYGHQVTKKFVPACVEMGFTITSGLALGIDGLSHQCALDSKGKTIAVQGVGLESVYPQRHQSLAAEILEKGGALVSEYGMGIRALPENFPRRNRIISGLSLGVIVIEATLKSGSLITAQYALEQGREVFAVPGSIFQPLSAGCHALIKQGAYCLDNIEILHEVFSRWIKTEKSPSIDFLLESSIKLSSEEAELLKCLNEVPQAEESLLSYLNWPPQKMQRVLMQLEMKSLIHRDAYGIARR